MVRQAFNVEEYWKVIVYYDVDCDFLRPLYKELRSIGFPKDDIKEIFWELKRERAKAVTCSNGAYHTSIVILKKHSSVEDYINSIIHETEHVKQAMLNTYMIEDKGEPPAYTIGYLVMRMWRVCRQFLCI